MKMWFGILVALSCVYCATANPRDKRQLFPGLEGIAESFFTCRVSGLKECPTSNHSAACSSLISSYFQIMSENGTVPHAPAKPTRRPWGRRTTTPRTPGSDDEETPEEPRAPKKTNNETKVVRDGGVARHKRDPFDDDDNDTNAPDGNEGRGRGRGQGQRGRGNRVEVRTDPDASRKKVCCFLAGIEKMRSECCANLKDLCSDLFIDESQDIFGGRGPFGGGSGFGGRGGDGPESDSEYGDDFPPGWINRGPFSFFNRMFDWFRENSPFNY